MTTLTPRQIRERDFHQLRAAEQSVLREQQVSFDVLLASERRPWNAHWSLYDRILAAGLRGKRLLVPGCGFGDDAIRLATHGAIVSAVDLSAEMLDIASVRAQSHGVTIQFEEMPAEALKYNDSSFDAAVLVDILHRVDIHAAISEIRRVLKPGGLIIGDGVYTHSALQQIRESRFVAQFLYPRMVRLIYGTDRPYITVDEHKIDEREFGHIAASFVELQVQYFNALAGRLFPTRLASLARLDHLALCAIGPLGRFVAGHLVFSGRKS